MDQSPSSLDPLPRDIHNGMIAMGLVGVLSTTSTLALLIFIGYRMIYWRRFYDQPLATNQIFILIFNLLLADFQQALSFLIAFYWLHHDKLVGPSNICFAQGWLIQIGDLSSGIWVLSIAVHTFTGLVLQKTIPFRAFVGGVLAIWMFCLILTAIGPIMHNTAFFVPAGVWCWIGEEHGTHRLTLHYLWIFVSQLGSVVIYLTIYLYLRFRVVGSIQPQGMLSDGSATTSSPSYNNNYPKRMVGVTTTTIVSNPARNPFVVSRQKILRTARYMVVYPFAYVTLTLPLAVGRVSAMANKNPPMIFYCVAGSMMASCGFIDVGLYMYTRKALVRSSIGLKESNGGPGDDNPSGYSNGNGIGDLDGESSDNIRMGGMNGDRDRDTDSLSIEQKETMGRSAIIVSRSVTRTEDQFPQNTKYQRSDSLKSLVEREENGSDKSWLAGT